MENKHRRVGVTAAGLLTLAAGIGLAGFGTSDRAYAQEPMTYTAEIEALNDSGASGTASVTVDGDQIMVEIDSTGLTPGLPHAQHLHIGGDNVCPAMDADEDGDNLVSTAEGQPFYGDVRVSLTTEGETDVASALAVDRFPVAEDDGTISYSRTFDIPDGVTAEELGNAVIVQHGIDLDENGEYDGDAPSSLDDSLPLEATIPAACGVLAEGATGGAGTATPEATGTEAPDATASPEATGTEAPGATASPEATGTEAPGATTTPDATSTQEPAGKTDPMAPPSAGSGGLMDPEGGSNSTLLYGGIAVIILGVLGLTGVAVAPALRKR